MGVDEERQLLIDLEIAAQDTRDQLEADRAEINRKLWEIAEAEARRESQKVAIKAARERLAREEALAAARDRASDIDDGLTRLVAKYEALAAGKPWHDGTGHDDPVLGHQMQGAMFGAVARRWILGDGVGLGKTRTAVGWMDLVEAKRVILVCEPNICDQFAGEVSELAPHRTIVNLYKRTPKARHELLDSLPDEGVVVVNFEIWRRDNDALAKLIAWHADTVVVDEAHNLKGTATANFKYVKMLVSVDNTCPNCKNHIFGLFDLSKGGRKIPKPCPTCGWKVDPESDKRGAVRHGNKLDTMLASRSVKNLCLTTGTPILNTPMDLFSLLHLCNPAAFPTAKAYQTVYLSNNYHANRWEWAPTGLDSLKPMIEGLFLARTREDAGIVLPPQHRHVVQVPLDADAYPKQAKCIQEINQAAQILLEDGESLTIMHLIALITRKRQANVWPGGIRVVDKEGNVTFDASSIDESVKMDRIIEKVLELSPRRQIVFSQFKTALVELQLRLEAQGLRVARFDGDTPKALRAEIKADFLTAHENPRWDVVLMNYKTGGTGINLVGATVAHVMDEEWNPGKRDQAYGRIDRMGQKSETDVYIYRIPGSIDTWMSNIITRKEHVIEGFEEALDPEDMREMLIEGLTS